MGPQELLAKNALITGDAAVVGAAFRDKLATLDATTGMEPTDEPSDRFEAATGEEALTANEPFLSPVENPSVDPRLSTPNAGRCRVPAKAIRLRDKEHRKYVVTQRCVMCGRTPAEAITSGSLSLARWGARSATNTRSQSAGCITASGIDMAMRPQGGL
ncbi:MAG: hypothetical protein WCF81_13510, partial [Roseiarcus sp.]